MLNATYHDPSGRVEGIFNGEPPIAQGMMNVPSYARDAVAQRCAPLASMPGAYGQCMSQLQPDVAYGAQLMGLGLPQMEFVPGFRGAADDPFYKKWWFWAAVGGGVVAVGGLWWWLR